MSRYKSFSVTDHSGFYYAKSPKIECNFIGFLNWLAFLVLTIGLICINVQIEFNCK